MSVGFANAVADGLRYNGVPVTVEFGWERRGNGLVFPAGRPKGVICHHTGGGIDTGLHILIRGRSDLPGPLCNSAGYSDGRVHIIAAHPANHAGASGGHATRPLPVTRLFNREVWGHEVMYPGSAPWTAAQYRSARILGGVICGILGRPNPDWCRSHHETSLTGKWDPGAGRGHGVPFDMNRFRAEIWDALTHNGEPPPPPPDRGRLPTLTYGQRSADVMALQRFMVRVFASYNSYVPTGFYGDLTTAGIAEFQRRVGIGGRDGRVVDPETNHALWTHGYRG